LFISHDPLPELIGILIFISAIDRSLHAKTYQCEDKVNAPNLTLKDPYTLISKKHLMKGYAALDSQNNVQAVVEKNMAAGQKGQRRSPTRQQVDIRRIPLTIR